MPPYTSHTLSSHTHTLAHTVLILARRYGVVFPPPPVRVVLQVGRVRDARRSEGTRPAWAVTGSRSIAVGLRCSICRRRAGGCTGRMSARAVARALARSRIRRAVGARRAASGSISSSSSGSIAASTSASASAAAAAATARRPQQQLLISSSASSSSSIYISASSPAAAASAAAAPAAVASQHRPGRRRISLAHQRSSLKGSSWRPRGAGTTARGD